MIFIVKTHSGIYRMNASSEALARFAAYCYSEGIDFLSGKPTVPVTAEAVSSGTEILTEGRGPTLYANPDGSIQV